MRRSLGRLLSPACIALEGCVLLAASRALAAGGPISFATQVAYTARGNPFSVAVGDLNGDGKPDIVMPSASENVVAVLLNSGTGKFPTHADYTCGTYTSFAALADLNGDGKLDIVATNANSNSLSILLGHGDGTFAPAVNIGAEASPYCVAIADLNGDGHPDLAVANLGTAHVSVYLGNGDGTFTVAAGANIVSGSRSLAIGDVNGDGKPDIVAANSTTNSISVLPGDGHGAFGAAQNYSVDPLPYGVAIADLNNDGRLDVVTANSGGATMSVLIQQPNHSLAPSVLYGTGPLPYGVTIADFNGDGIPDVAISRVNQNSVSVFAGNGDGSFAPKSDFATGQDPFFSAAADFDGDGRLDLAIANEGTNAVGILLNNSPTGLATSVVLATTPNPSIFGQPVQLTATIGPDAAATGTVIIQDGSFVIASATATAGVAQVSLNSLLAGTHSLQASYQGDGTHLPSVSGIVNEVVNLAATTVTLGANSNPAAFRLPVQFTASVATVAPGGGTPDGTVAFKLDGNAFGAAATLTNGIARSDTNTTLNPGTHQIDATYSPAGSNKFAGSIASTFTLEVVAADPTIVGVHDVPNDQGGKVAVTWHYTLDQPGANIVTGYRVWRRVADPVAAARAGIVLRARRAVGADSSSKETFWEALADLPSAALVSYGYTAATTQDSIAGSNPYTAFFIQALTANPLVWYDSAPDSGYSVDNLAPPAPTPFAVQYTLQGASLHWSASRAPDLALYHLHRGTTVDFTPDAANLIDASRDTSFLDPTGAGQYVYKLAGVDIHGNVGRYAIVSPVGPTATLATFLAPEVTEHSVTLHWYLSTDEPLSLDVQRRGVIVDWAPLATVTSDNQGFVSYEDDAVEPGARYGYRLDMRSATGAETLAGEGWIDVPATLADASVRVASPVVGGEVDVSFVPPAGRTTRVALYDLAGRLVATQEVPGGGGRTTLALASSARLAPGLYLVRVGFAHPVTARVVVAR